MGQSLLEIAQTLRATDKKVQLIYAFNGTGKTRLSRAFKQLVAPPAPETEDGEAAPIRVLYYNAYTEDLFFWDNVSTTDADRKLSIRPNGFTNLALEFLKDQGQDGNIAANFQHYASDDITPLFSPDFSEVTFSLTRGNDENLNNIKVSKGEESNFIWCVFYSLLELVVDTLNTPEPDERDTRQFDDLEYVFIDDPVSSLDENHLIGLAVSIAGLIKRSNNIKFILSTHSPLFYNVLHNELGSKACFMLHKSADSTFELQSKKGDSNKSFSYHLFLKSTIEEAISQNNIQRYHFTLLRNLYEKTANFLGYPRWSDLLPGDQKVYYNRVIQFTSHSTLSNEAVAEPTNPEKQTVKFLLDHLITNFSYWKEERNEIP